MQADIERYFSDELRDDCLPWAAELEAGRRFRLDARAVEAAALAGGFQPARYARNRGLFGLQGQRAFHAARIVVAGCGGLGGHLVEFLARLGIGTIIAVDPDAFDETNLNRQPLATLAELGKPKVEAAFYRVAAVNPAVRLIAIRERLAADNAERLIAGAAAVADGLDTMSGRLELADACMRLGVPFVHAGVAGWYGQAATQTPAGRSMAALYGSVPAGAGIEAGLGNQAFAPAFAAAIQTAEICKLVMGRPAALADRLFFFDLLAMETVSFKLD